MDVFLKILFAAKKARKVFLFFNSILLSNFLSSPAYAQSTSNTSTLSTESVSSVNHLKSKNSAQISLKGFSTKNETAVSRGFNFDINADLNYDLAPELSLRVRPGALLSSSQQVFRDEDSRQANNWYLLEASAAFHLFKGLDLYFGALNQKDYFSKITMANLSFPAMGLQVTLLDQANHIIKLSAESAVPTSSGIATQVGDLEEPPSLDSVGFKIESQWNSKITTSIQANQFEFRNLPTSLATAGLKLGNTAQKYNSNSYAYLYNYKGYEASAGTNLVVYRNSGLNLSYSQVTNTQAPIGMNQGVYTKIEPVVYISSRLTVKPFIENYRIESDAVVANYADASVGRPNRIGSTQGVAFAAKNYSLSFSVSEDKTLKETPFQSGETMYFLKLETSNVAL